MKAVIRIDDQPPFERTVHSYSKLPSQHDPIAGALNGKPTTLHVSSGRGQGEVVMFYLYFMFEGKVKYVNVPALYGRGNRIAIDA
jgi:hypothetical protein